ncbi:nuclear transport factor 2 family protein [Poritiphilus flavus]|uniref:DUF4440 domain-containing protein n=1 Tax=Poritiphilus flavus TaxID=2697053 RepID=A0A6L9ED21_9FLAO|nr:nuclear transport factor 2 family protein [Poritiphilus flavus]NAS12289.1 DUF4440 domain-containing protein [Poritiphilus flavus]
MGSFKRTLCIFMMGITPLIHAQTESQEHTNLVKTLSDAYHRAVMEENTKELIRMLHPEVVFHPPSGEPYSGKDIVGQLIKSFLEKNDVTSWAVTIDSYTDLGNSLVEFGRFEMVENKETTSKRKYINIWVRNKENYRLFYRGWSSL